MSNEVGDYAAATSAKRAAPQQGMSFVVPCYALTLIAILQGNLSVATLRLLKNIIPSACLWTTLRESEGLDYDTTIEALNELFPISKDGDDAMDEGDDSVPNGGIPEGIRGMLDSRPAVEAIGQMVWCVVQR